MTVITREPQYSVCFDEPLVMLGPMTGATWRWNPRRLGMMLARYKFVAKMLAGKKLVAEIGAADGFGAEVVRQEVGTLELYDFDPAFEQCVHDIVEDRLPYAYDAIYLLDVLEHVHPHVEHKALANIVTSLHPTGICIVGMPSLESQKYANPISLAGHVNCKTGDDLKATMQQHFDYVFMFGMNDEVLHTGYFPMCHYLIALCAGPRHA